MSRIDQLRYAASTSGSNGFATSTTDKFGQSKKKVMF